jgi:hypothetical protein
MMGGELGPRYLLRYSMSSCSNQKQCGQVTLLVLNEKALTRQYAASYLHSPHLPRERQAGGE